jgi:hypothetical protein
MAIKKGGNNAELWIDVRLNGIHVDLGLSSTDTSCTANPPSLFAEFRISEPKLSFVELLNCRSDQCRLFHHGSAQSCPASEILPLGPAASCRRSVSKLVTQ